MGRRHDSLIGTLRQAVRDSDIGQNEIARRLDLSHGAMSHFVNGRRGLTAENLDKLADLLGYELVKIQKGTRR